MVYLDIETPDGTHRVTLERERLSIGRMASNDVVLAFPQVSRQHAELRLIGGQWWIADLHSTNGLQLDMRRIQDHALRDGDRIVLAPGISIRFIATSAGSAVPDRRSRTESAPLWQESRPPQPPVSRSSPLAAAQPTPVARTVHAPPAEEPAPPSYSSAPASAPAPVRAPASHGRKGEYSRAAGASHPDAAATPVEFWSAARTAGPAPTVPVDPSESDAYASVAGSANAHGGYPVPRGPLHSGAPVGGADPFRRDAPAGEARRATAGPATLLHVCQTCGQRTEPASIYCQHCHNSIASECANCRLSLLPIQDRCPRCHAPNLHSVRRVRARQTAM